MDHSTLHSLIAGWERPHMRAISMQANGGRHTPNRILKPTEVFLVIIGGN